MNSGSKMRLSSPGNWQRQRRRRHFFMPLSTCLIKARVSLWSFCKVSHLKATKMMTGTFPRTIILSFEEKVVTLPITCLQKVNKLSCSLVVREANSKSTDLVDVGHDDVRRRRGLSCRYEEGRYPHGRPWPEQQQRRQSCGRTDP